MNIEERIKEVDLRPSDIVKLQVLAEGKPISLSQASGWIKNPTATKAIEQLLWRLCDEKVESGLTFSKPGRKKELGIAGIFSGRLTVPSDSTEAVLLANAASTGMAKKITPTQEEAKKWLREFELPSGEPGIGVDVSKQFHSTDSVLNAVGRQKIPAIPSLVTPEIEQMSALIANTKEEAVKVAYIGAPKLPSATPTNFASWGINGTMKIAGKMVKFNMNDLSYVIGLEKAKSGFLVDAKVCKLSDFTEVK